MSGHVYGRPPVKIADFKDIDLREVMYYLYLPVKMGQSEIRLPGNLELLRTLVRCAITYADLRCEKRFRYVYLSARKGWATPDNPLNRPGWHADGFGTDDLNVVWWKGAGTRFAIQTFDEVPSDHLESIASFTRQIRPECVRTYAQGGLYAIDPYVVHATPALEKGEWRQYVKVSLSNHQYNLENNSHNYLFNYDWTMLDRDEVRNNPYKAGQDNA